MCEGDTVFCTDNKNGSQTKSEQYEAEIEELQEAQEKTVPVIVHKISPRGHLRFKNGFYVVLQRAWRLGPCAQQKDLSNNAGPENASTPIMGINSKGLFPSE